MTAAPEGAKMPGDSMIRYWFLWLGLGVPALIVILTWLVSVSLINTELGMIWALITSHKSEIYDIASWLMVMVLSGCIITMQVAPANSSARIGANYFSKTLIMLLATVFCVMLTEFLPLPVVCIVWLMVAITFICAWRG